MIKPICFELVSEVVQIVERSGHSVKAVEITLCKHPDWFLHMDYLRVNYKITIHTLSGDFHIGNKEKEDLLDLINDFSTNDTKVFISSEGNLSPQSGSHLVIYVSVEKS